MTEQTPPLLPKVDETIEEIEQAKKALEKVEKLMLMEEQTRRNSRKE